MEKKYDSWWRAIMSKMSLAISVCDETEQKKLFEIRKKMKVFINQHNILDKKKLFKNKKEIMEYEKRKSNIPDIDDLLFEAEAIVDVYLNKHMPFLRIPEETDWTPEEW